MAGGSVRQETHIGFVSLHRERSSIRLLELLVEHLTTVSPSGFCGQTHVHKAAFIAQELLAVPFQFEWELYRYGPFSRDIRPSLEACELEGTVSLLDHPKGTRIVRPEDAPRAEVAAEFQSKLQLLAQRLAPMTRQQLEKVATAAWVSRLPHQRSASARGVGAPAPTPPSATPPGRRGLSPPPHAPRRHRQRNPRSRISRQPLRGGRQPDGNQVLPVEH